MRSARLQVLGAALLFSFGGAAIKATTLSGAQVACARSAVAAVALWLLLPEARRLLDRRAVLVGLAYSGALGFYALANKLTTAASTIFLQSTTPLYVLVLAPLLLGERLRRRDLAFMTVVAAGLALVFVELDPVQPTAPRPLVGNLLACGAGACFGSAIVGMRWLGRGGGDSVALASVVWGNLFVTLATAGSALPFGRPTARDAGLVLFLGTIQIGLAYVLLTRGLERLPAFETSLLLLVEPVFNPIWAWVLHGEGPGRGAAVGGVLILGSTAAKVLYEARLERRRGVSPSARGRPDSARRGGPGDPP